MTIKEFCNQYGKTEANVYAKLRRSKNELGEHISKTPYSKTLVLDEYAVNYLLTDKRSGNAAEIVSKFEQIEEPIKLKEETQLYKFWSDDKSKKVMDMCFEEVKTKRTALKYVPDGFKTYDLCKFAVENHGMALEYVPERYISDELCRIAVEKCYTAFAFVPQKYMSEKIITSVFDDFSKDDPENKQYIEYKRHLLEYVPEKQRSKEICLKAITARASNIKYIPLECFTDEIVKEALKTNVGIANLPEKYFYNEDVINIALKSETGRRRIPIEYWTKPNVIAAIKNYGFEGIPREAFDFEFYLMLINERYITPKQILDRRDYSDGLTEKEISSIREIHFQRQEKYDELYELIMQDPHNIRLMSFDDEQYDLYVLTAVSLCGDALKYVPSGKRSYDLCKCAVTQDMNALLYVPDEYKDQMVEMLAKKDDLLKYIFDGSYFSEIFIK